MSHLHSHRLPSRFARRITGGTNKQFEDRVREKKGSWTSEQLCVGLTGSSQTFLALARGGEEPDCKFILEAFESDIEQGRYIKGSPIILPESGNPQGIVLHIYLRASCLTSSVPLDYAPPLDIKRPKLPDAPAATTDFLLPLSPGDFIKLKALPVLSLQFGGPAKSIQIDPSDG